MLNEKSRAEFRSLIEMVEAKDSDEIENLETRENVWDLLKNWFDFDLVENVFSRLFLNLDLK